MTNKSTNIETKVYIYKLGLGKVLTLLTTESLWLSGRTSESKVRRSRVPFLMGTWSFMFVVAQSINQSFYLVMQVTKVAAMRLMWTYN